jgi:hypothetical protein
VLGGSAGTTYDAFRLIHDAQKYGARVALFGRKINQAEHQLGFIEMLRLITEGRVGPEEAVRAYHGILQATGIQARRPLEQDLQLTDQAMSYGASTTTRVHVPANPLPHPPAPSPAASTPPTPASASAEHPTNSWPTHPDGSPDFARMTSTQRAAFDTARLKRRFG